ncbi:MAG: molybdopterin converting factor subunit 1 [Myxococcaceae bacterium]|nr:molybdopterin converting factor subunit 1 [Myxococcaceae bacterium]
MSVTVRYFAAAREKARASSDVFTLPAGATVGELLAAVYAKRPALQSLEKHLRVAVDEEFAPVNLPLADGVEVALIPPVAGGTSGLFRVVDRPLSLAEVVDAVSGPGQGGLVTFSGAVRAVSKGQSVSHLEYEAYPPMAEKQMARIADEARAKWPGTQVAIVHRVGRLEPGDLAVVIAASAPHRKEAFLACEWAIDRLKQDVPIWKKETTSDGAVWVGLGP